MENIFTIKESLIYSTLYVQTVPKNIRIFINTSPSAVSDYQILKFIRNGHLVRIQCWMSQSNPERISQTQINPDIIS